MGGSAILAVTIRKHLPRYQARRRAPGARVGSGLLKSRRVDVYFILGQRTNGRTMKVSTSTLCAIFVIGISNGSSAIAQDEEPMMQKSQSGIALGDPVDWAMCAPAGVAVGGYDLISYRDSEGPVVGDKNYSADYNGATYWFANQTNLDIFVQDPARYLPAYSGFCAITLALGRITCPEYTNFKIEGDRLFLFEITGFTNGRTLWNSDPAGFRRRADNNFKDLVELQ